MLDTLQRETFRYFQREVNPANGLVADKTEQGAPASIAAVGLALAAYPIGVERGFTLAERLRQRSLTAAKATTHREGPGAALTDPEDMDEIKFFLEPTPPFRLDLTAWVLRRRPDNAWDRWDGQVYRRLLMLNDRPVEVAVTQTSPPDAPRLRVVGVSSGLPADAVAPITAALERLLGLRSDLTAFYDLAGTDPRLSRLAQTYRGVKPPRFLTLFEAVVNAIACQQLTLTVGIRLLNRLSQRYGAAFPATDADVYAFPRPQDLAAVDREELWAMGYSRHKALAMLELANAIAGGGVDLESLDDLDDETASRRLLQLRGVGRWTAEYVLLRGMGRLHVFPGDDVGARNNLRRRLRVAEPLDYEAVGRVVSPWQPFAGLLYFHLLLDSLAEAGYLAAEPALAS